LPQNVGFVREQRRHRRRAAGSDVVLLSNDLEFTQRDWRSGCGSAERGRQHRRLSAPAPRQAPAACRDILPDAVGRKISSLEVDVSH
jgi:hypothetical protein